MSSASTLRFLRLPLADQLTTVEALVVVAGTCAALNALPRSVLSRWVSRAMRRPSAETLEASAASCFTERCRTTTESAAHIGPNVLAGARPRRAGDSQRRGPFHGLDQRSVAAVDRVCRSVRRASLRVPGATCLVQALCGWIMLQRRHVAARVEVGVDKQADGLRAHAWLVVADHIVLGGEDARAHFVVLQPRQS